MKQPLSRGLAAAVSAIAVAIALTLVPSSASAYQPSPGDVYVAQNPGACNKRPCVLYPKTAQLPNGRIVATFEDSQQAVVGQTLPIFRSDDDGTTWQKLADVPAPASLSNDPAHARYTSNWTNAHLYVLPHQVGSLAAGTLLLASVVSGADEYFNEQKAANPSWTPSGDGDRRDIAIALYASTNNGANWQFLNIIAAGGWQGGSAGATGRTANANTADQVDPLWEPHLLARNGQLIAYYSDENDYLGYNTTTGVATIDPANATAADSHGQVLVHRTWNGVAGSGWSQTVVDVAGLTVDRGNGKTQIGGGRPGMTTVAPTTDGRWILTYEYFGGGANVRYRISDDPLRFWAAADAPITSLPVPSGGAGVPAGGSPVVIALPDGRLVYNSAGSQHVWVNESGRSDGTWKQYQTTIATGYSRNLQYVQGTGRLLILQAAWAGGSVGPVKYAEFDIGLSDGTYYSLVNRATGQVLAPTGNRTQDANLTGNQPDLIVEPADPADATQRWHTQPKGSNVTFLNKAGGRSMAIWTGNATAGQRLAQWVDDGATDKAWTLVPTSNGYHRIQSVRDTSLYLTASTAGGAATLQTLNTGSTSQEWQLVPETEPSSFALHGAHSNRCLDVPNGATGVQLQIWDCVGNANQTITPTAADELRIRGNCLASDGNGTATGTRLILWACNGSNSQKWEFRVDGTIANRLSGLVIDVSGWATANGSPVQLWTGLGNATQRWSRA